MTVLSDLSRALETATDLYAEACDDTAEAENDYLRTFHKALASSSAPATIRIKLSDGVAIEEKCILNTRSAVERAVKAKVESLKARLSAAQSHQRFVRDQTGGDA